MPTYLANLKIKKNKKNKKLKVNKDWSFYLREK